MRYLLMLADVLSGGHTEMSAEGSREGGLTGVAYSVGNLGDIEFLFGKQAGCLFHTDILDEVVNSETRHLFHLTMQMGAADTCLGTDKADVKVAVRDIIVDALHDAFHEQFVITLHLNVPNKLINAAGVSIDNLQSRLKD